MYGVDGKKFQRQYKQSISDFKNWKQKSHAQDLVLYPENISSQLSINEVALSDGELYTILTSKHAKGRKGCLVAIIKGTKSETVIECLFKISRKLRMKVNEITLDMAGSMKRITQRCFPNAARVIDRFTHPFFIFYCIRDTLRLIHVQKLAIEALQEIRIRHRWDAVEMENKVMEGLDEEQILSRNI